MPAIQHIAETKNRRLLSSAKAHFPKDGICRQREHLTDLAHAALDREFDLEVVFLRGSVIEIQELEMLAARTLIRQ